jgi:hypothetical protein
MYILKIKKSQVFGYDMQYSCYACLCKMSVITFYILNLCNGYGIVHLKDNGSQYQNTTEKATNSIDPVKLHRCDGCAGWSGSILVTKANNHLHF